MDLLNMQLPPHLLHFRAFKHTNLLLTYPLAQDLFQVHGNYTRVADGVTMHLRSTYIFHLGGDYIN